MQKFSRICEVENCPKLELKRDVRTRWNSTFSMIDRALLLKSAYQSMCATEHMLSTYRMECDDWAYLQQLRDLLCKFEGLTKVVSASQVYPTINRTIAVYNSLIDHIEDFIENKDNDPSIALAASEAKMKLSQYYTKTDNTPVYAVATAMDPRMRFSWWRANDWGEDLERMSKGMVTDVWTKYYKGGEAPLLLDAEIAEQMKLYGIKVKAGELDEYVNEGSQMVTSKDEPAEFMYWRAQSQRWPNLANMARDYLAIPATSTPAERCFSQAKFALPPERNKLLPGSIQRLVLLDSWMKEPSICLSDGTS